MVSASEWLKKSQARRSKNSKFKAVKRRAWDYIEPAQPIESVEETKNVIWEQKEEQIGIVNGNNWEQSRNDIGNNREQIREQFGNESSNKYGNNFQAATSIKPKIKESKDELTEDTAQKKILTLTGYQKQVMRHITSHIKSKVGTPYVIDVLPHILASKINANLEVTRITLKRLVVKNILVRLPGERGRNGCCRFEIHENIIKICFSLFNDAPCGINQIGNEIGNKNGNNIPYSSSYNINTTTVLPANWEQIDISSLSDIGFSKTQLVQLFEKQLNDPDVIQESINHFAFGVDNNPKIKTYSDPLNVLMGVLRKGGVWIEKNYISAKEKAMTDLLALKRDETVRIQELEKKLVSEEFKLWLVKLSANEKEKILNAAAPKSNLLSKAVANQVDEGNLFQHFKLNIYGKAKFEV